MARCLTEVAGGYRGPRIPTFREVKDYLISDLVLTGIRWYNGSQRVKEGAFKLLGIEYMVERPDSGWNIGLPVRKVSRVTKPNYN